MASAKSPNIPVVDFAGWNTESSRQRIAQEIVATCKQLGFVYIINHFTARVDVRRGIQMVKTILRTTAKTRNSKRPIQRGGQFTEGTLDPG